MLTQPVARSAVTDKRRSVIIFKGKRAPGTGGAKAGRQGTSRTKSGARIRSCVHSRPAHALKNAPGFSGSPRHPEQMPRAALTSGYTCLLRGSASSLERGSALRLGEDSHLSPFLQTEHLLAWTLSQPRPSLFCPQGLKTSIYLPIKGFNRIK